MKIFYLGDDDPCSSANQRAQALTRLGHTVRHLNPAIALRPSRVLGKLHYLTGYTLAAARVRRWVLEQARQATFDLVWVDGGAMVSRELVNELKSRCGRVVNYNLDDPTGTRDGNFWRTFLRALPAYDLCVVVRDESAAEFRAFGARAVLQVYRGYDEVAHAPIAWSASEAEKWSAPVAFVGTWMPERGGLLAELARADVPLAIYGNRWEKAPEWPALRRVWRGPGVLGADYVKAIQGAQISLGLVSRGNRDRHTQRSAEIPFIGGLLCAERTREHSAMYREETEAVFWRDAQECVKQCRLLLVNPLKCRAIAAAGQQRAQALGLGNEVTLARILACVTEPSRSTATRRVMLCS